MEKTLTGKVALVTGGSRGIGAATALALAKEGADVAIGYVRSEEKAQAMVERIRALGVRAVAIRADQADPVQAEAIVGAVVAEFGHLDILINSAGINAFGAVDGPQTDFAAIDHFWQVNMTGARITMRAAARVMRDHGRIISVGSPLGVRAGFPAGSDNAGTIGGISAYSRGIARDLGHRNITVNMIHIGLVETDISEMYRAFQHIVWDTFIFQRYAEMDEITAPIVFLASPAASFITGTTLTVDGGYSA